MFIFKKRKPAQVLNDLDAYLSALGTEPIELIGREIQRWGEISYSELEEIIRAGLLDEYLDWQGKYSAFVNETLNPLWTSAFLAAAERATRGKIILSDSDLDVRNWLATHGGEFITSESAASRRAIAAIVAHETENLIDPRRLARQIRPLIGLTEAQSIANLNYRERLRRELIANGATATRAEAQSERAALRYATSQHRYRAETIAHTELAFAYNRGADAGVRRAIRQGLMGRCALIWTTAGTNRVCGRCMDLKDTIVGYTDESGVTLPPLHPRCRCAIMYDEVGEARLPQREFAPSNENISSETVPQGTWRRQAHFSTSEENIKATNPNYALGAAFQMNCQKCVPTYEMRMRGYDVTARPTFDVKTDSFAQDYWDKAFKGAVLEEGFSGDGKEEIIRRMKTWGAGTRSEVYVAWEKGGSHVFVAENRAGEIHFLDPQTGELNVEHYFEHVKAGLTKLLHIDNLEPDEKNIRWCCKEVKRGADT